MPSMPKTRVPMLFCFVLVLLQLGCVNFKKLFRYTYLLCITFTYISFFVFKFLDWGGAVVGFSSCYPVRTAWYEADLY